MAGKNRVRLLGYRSSACKKALFFRPTKLVHHGPEKRVDATIVELARDSPKHRQGLVGHVVADMPVSADLFAHGTKRVFTSGLLELIEHHKTRKIEHVDLLKLRMSPELCGHHVD